MRFSSSVSVSAPVEPFGWQLINGVCMGCRLLVQEPAAAAAADDDDADDEVGDGGEDGDDRNNRRVGDVDDR